MRGDKAPDGAFFIAQILFSPYQASENSASSAKSDGKRK
jgi:hypothetical protein